VVEAKSGRTFVVWCQACNFQNLSLAQAGKKLYYETWKPSGWQPSVSRTLAFFFHEVHGSADTTTVRELAAKFAGSLGVEFICMEHQGHGRSYGTKALVDSWDSLCENAVEFIQWRLLKSANNQQDKFFVAGHSLGGAIVAWTGDQLKEIYKDRFLGAIMIAPGLSGPPVPSVKLMALRAVCLVAPWAPLGPPENPDGSMKPDEALKYKSSPHNYIGNMRLGTGKMFIDLFEKVDKHLDMGKLKLDFEFLILHGDKDHTVHISISQRLVDASQSKDKSLVVLEGEGHQPLCNDQRLNVLETIGKWTKVRLPRPTG